MSYGCLCVICNSLRKDKASKPQWGKQRGTPQSNLRRSINTGRSKLAPEGK